MSSSFASAADAIFRVGDFVRTMPHGARNRSMDASQLQHRSTTSTKHNSSKSSSSSSHVGRPTSSSSLMRSDTDDSLRQSQQDLSSPQAWWKSLTQGTWLQEHEDVTLTGVIDRIDWKTGTAVVSVWMRGAAPLADLPSKPRESMALCHLQKLSPLEFHHQCRKPFMQAATRHLKLRGEGYDESAPMALISHNNRIISDLIGRIDTSAKMSLKDVPVRRPRGPGDMIRAPIPVAVPIEDPLANARTELEALQATGLVQYRKKPGRSGGGPLGSSTPQPDREAISNAINADRCVASRCEPRGGSTAARAASASMLPAPLSHNSAASASGIAGSKSQSPQPQSFLEDTVEGERRVVMSHLRVASAPMATTGSSLARSKVVQPLLPDRCFPLPPAAPLNSTTGNGVKTFNLSEVEGIEGGRPNPQQRSTAAASSSTKMDVVVAAVRRDGTFLLRRQKGVDAPFLAKLAHVELRLHPTTEEALSGLERCEAVAVPMYRDRMTGACACDLVIGSESVVERVLREGFGTLQISALSEEAAPLIFGSLEAAALSRRHASPTAYGAAGDMDDEALVSRPLNLGMETLQRYVAAQDEAIRLQKGLWQSSTSSASAPSSTIRASQAAALDLTHVIDGLPDGDSDDVDGGGQADRGEGTTDGTVGGERAHLPPLFDNFESSQWFRNKLREHIRRS